MVVPGRAGSSWTSAGCSAAASAMSAARSPTGRPSSTSRVCSTKGSRTRSGMPEPILVRQLGQVRHRVVAHLGHRRVAGLAERHQPHRAGALLADAEGQHGPPVDQLQPLAGALVDRHRRPDVGPLLEQPTHADVGAAVLLVGDREEPQVAAGPEALPGQRRHRDRPGRDLVLHVDGAAAPQPAVVVEHRLERRVGPLLAVDRHHVGVADEGQRRCVRVGAGDPCHQVGARRAPGPPARPRCRARHR